MNEIAPEIHKVLVDVHSVLRYVILVLMLVTIVDSIVRMYKPEDDADRKLALFSLISLHTQILIGVIIYFISPKIQTILQAGKVMSDTVSRFWAVEHMVGMILAAVLVTVGYSRSKKQVSHWAKHRFILVYYTIALIIILLMIPWPFRQMGIASGWF
jgi:membrane-associated HD superfamily phosphohydrolase